MPATNNTHELRYGSWGRLVLLDGIPTDTDSVITPAKPRTGKSKAVKYTHDNLLSWKTTPVPQ